MLGTQAHERPINLVFFWPEEEMRVEKPIRVLDLIGNWQIVLGRFIEEENSSGVFDN